jgi:hypothetical protein
MWMPFEQFQHRDYDYAKIIVRHERTFAWLSIASRQKRPCRLQLRVRSVGLASA